MNVKKWNELSEEQRRTAVTYLRNKLAPEFWEGMRAARDKNPSDWWAEGGWHFGQGMAIRNLLRDVILDAELPSGNWDDYYVEALEVALDTQMSVTR